MSKKDLQFIDQALAHPWMFWVYFWKWPRIVRQACAEYDLLAKERDVAKEAHEQAVKANKIVRDWIHVTHRLDMTADMRAIWTAGKRLSALLLFLALTLSANAQLPPILRNQWTTNASPLALKVVSTNGVHAATNIWELDFTNTASVTVSAVSNANKVMVSFTGAASGGDTIWTNDGTAVMIAADTNRVRHFAEQTVFGPTNQPISMTNAGIMMLTRDDGISPGCYGKVSSGAVGAFFYFATNCFVRADDGAWAGGLFDGSHSGGCSNSFARAFDGSHAGGLFDFSHDTFIDAREGGYGGAYFAIVRSCYVQANEGGYAAGSINEASNCFIQSIHGGLASGKIGRLTTATTTNASIYASAGIAVGIVPVSNERIRSQGDSVGALAVGRDIASTNNWTFGIHYTNAIPLSLAVGANGTTQFRAASNSVVIRTETAPTVGQILTATDTSGTVGWSNAPAASGGGIASIFTNNVLAGGPGLTELEFTNSATVTVESTTNAGRVTVSFTSATGSGIATNNGIGWNTTLLNVTNTTATTTTVPLTVQGIASQTSDLQQWLSSTGTTNALMQSNGVLRLPSTTSIPQLRTRAGGDNGIYLFDGGAVDFYNSGGTANIRFGTAGNGIFYDRLEIHEGGLSPLLSIYYAGANLMGVGPGGNSAFASLKASNITATANLSVGMGVGFSRFATNGNVTLTTNFYVWGWTAIAVAGTLTLPSASTTTGIHFIIKDEGGNASTTNITIAVQSGDRIDGATTATINNNYGAKNVYSAGSTNWFVF